jgi:uncharacterized cupin superfamily protein
VYTPSILTTPLRPTGPADPAQPDGAQTSDWSMLDDDDVQIGIWECTPGRFNGDNGAFDEVMAMVGGRVTVTHDGGTHDIASGTVWTTPHEWKGEWQVHQTVRKLYVIDNRPPVDAAPKSAMQFVRNAYSTVLGSPRARPNIISGEPTETTFDVWKHNHIEVGVWECTPGSYRIHRDGYDETMLILAGRATLFAENGMAFPIAPGVAMVTPNGFSGHWVIEEAVRKVYVITRR